MIGIGKKGKREIILNEDEIGLLYLNIEKEFDIRKKKITGDTVFYELSAGVNRMQWVDGASIKIYYSNERTAVEFSISTIVQFVICHVFATGFFLYQTIKNGQPVLGVLPFLLLTPVAFISSFLSNQVFEFRLNNVINRITSGRTIISKQQTEWINNPGKCPACGFNVNPSSKNCPDCELKLL